MAKLILNKSYGFGYCWNPTAAKRVLEMKMESQDTDIADAKNLLEDLLESKKHNVGYVMHIDREDPEAIAILEEYGSEFCSGEDAKLEICEYDGTKYRPRIESYDGREIAFFEPCVSVDTIRACGSVDNIIALLLEIGAAYDD